MNQADVEKIFQSFEIGVKVLEELAAFTGYDKHELLRVMATTLPAEEKGGPDEAGAYEAARERALGETKA